MAGEIAAAGIGAVSGALGMIGQNKRAKKQHNRQKELMGIQLKNQQQLNKQGQKLQMQTWRDTNYGAQMDMMKDAGLNPALMYGMSGGGGATTGSQGGGSAQGGNSHAPMDIGASVQASLMMAQAMKLKAETKEIEAKTDKVGQDISESQQRVIESISKVALNEKMGITEDSKAKLNGSIEKLNGEQVKKAISETELNNADLNWMKDTGLNRNDSVVTKTMKYLSDETGLEAKTILMMIGGAKAFEILTKGIGNIVPAKKITNIVGRAVGKNTFKN
jgi:hypothetical protein